MSTRTFLRDTLRPFAAQADSWRRRAEHLRSDARRAYADAVREVDGVARQLGLPPRPEPHDVIDMGAAPSWLVRLTRLGASAVALVCVVGALVAFVAFCAQLLVAFLIATQVLGIRVDVASPAR